MSTLQRSYEDANISKSVKQTNFPYEHVSPPNFYLHISTTVTVIFLGMVAATGMLQISQG